MAYNDLRVAIKALLDGVTDIGVTHTRERWSDTWPSFLSLFKTQVNGEDQIRGWTISRTSKVMTVSGASREASVNYTEEFLIRGFLGFSDADDTDGTFQALVDTIVTALNGDKNLSDAAGVVDYGAVPVEVRILDLRMFGRVMCHYTEMRYTVQVMEDF